MDHHRMPRIRFLSISSNHKPQAKCGQHFKYPMNPTEFKQKTQGLLKYNSKQERDVVVADTRLRDCEYCPRQVTAQVIACEPHKLGTEQQHFKHKCYTCRHTVYDGSFKLTPRTLRPFNNYVPTIKRLPGTPTSPRLSKNGAVMGRPRKNPLP